MSLVTAYRGQPTTAEVYFYVPGTTTPLVLVGGASYSIFTPGNILVGSGIGTQDNTNAAHWTANFTIPSSAPVTTGNEKYYIIWTGNTANGSNSSSESFTLVDDSVNNPVDSVVVALVGNPFNVNLQLPFPALESLSIRIINTNNYVLYSNSTYSTTPTTQNGPNYVYTMNVNPTVPLQLPPNSGGLNQLYAYINYTDPNGNQLTEIQPVYLANPLVVSLMNDVRKYLDMLRNNDTISQLRYSEATLLHFVFQGMVRFNGCPPIWVALDFNIMQCSHRARNMYWWVLKCAQLELIEAMYLAEGMTAFEMQGMSVQLNSDRTQYLDSIRQGLRTDLDKMQQMKMQEGRRGGFSGRIGTIGTVFGPNTNFVYGIQPGAGGLGSFGFPILPFLG